eukprot:gene15649-biopygen717
MAPSAVVAGLAAKMALRHDGQSAALTALTSASSRALGGGRRRGGVGEDEQRSSASAAAASRWRRTAGLRLRVRKRRWGDDAPAARPGGIIQNPNAA